MKPQVHPYIGRIAPSPTGYLHLGHASTFHIAHQRALLHNGTLILRNEDLDPDRSKPHFVSAFIEDLQWLGISWQQGPIHQSQRINLYLEAWESLQNKGLIYPCQRSRKEINDKNSNIFPPEFRSPPCLATSPSGSNWRFKVPLGHKISFVDQNLGPQSFTAGTDFGDFLIWRKDNIPSYELSVVVDDHLNNITEVVRGQDLLLSTARQLLIYQALNWTPPSFYHCKLICDKSGQKLAKRYDSLSLRSLRHLGVSPSDIINANFSGFD